LVRCYFEGQAASRMAGHTIDTLRWRAEMLKLVDSVADLSEHRRYVALGELTQAVKYARAQAGRGSLTKERARARTSSHASSGNVIAFPRPAPRPGA
jgi:hypothetical protein